MKKGRVLEVTFDDLHYNLALEEAIFTNIPNANYSMTVRFWQNPMSVNLGRGQDLAEEIDAKSPIDLKKKTEEDFISL